MPLQIILVEDSQAHAELVLRALDSSGEDWSVRLAVTLSDAREKVLEKMPDLMLLDLHLPDGTAMELLPGSLDDAMYPVVVMTGQGDEAFAVACIKAGAMDYLVKSPETVRTLPKTIERISREWQRILGHRKVQASLLESEERYRTLVENVPGAVYRAAVSWPWKLLHVSHEVSSLTGYGPEEFSGSNGVPWGFIVFEDDQKRIEDVITLATDERTAFVIEYRVRTKGGSMRHVQDRGRCTYGPDGKPLWIDGVVFDITERRQVEQALRENEERLRLAMDAANAGLWDWDVKQDRVYWSPKNYQMIGLGEDAVVGCIADWKGRLHPDELEHVFKEITDQINANGQFSQDYRMRTRDGTYKWINARGIVVNWTEDRRPLRLVGTNSDIDQRVQAEIRLQESNVRLFSLFDEANDAIILTDGESGVILDANHQAEVLVERGKKELIGQPLSTLYPWDAQETASKLFLAARSARTGRQIAEVDISTTARGRVPVEVSVSTINQPDGRMIRMGIFRDLTGRRLLESQLRQAQKMEAIGQLAGGIAHDFNNVLAAIMLQIGILQNDKRVPLAFSSTLTLLEASTKRASELTRQLLLFGRRQPAKMQAVDLDTLLANLLKMLRRLIGETIQLEFQPHPNRCWLHADPGMLEQVVMNLVVNARDAMPQGGRIVIATKVAESRMPVTWAERTIEPEKGSYVCLAITDTGCGMSGDVLRKLFEPFFTTRELGKGTGLGLATAYGIVKQHKGWIEVESEEGKGSCFRVFLPLKIPVHTVRGEGEDEAGASGGGETILLVEDDAIVRTFTSLTLRATGYSVLEASDGDEARAVWDKHKDRIQVLITDMVMPRGLTGWDVVMSLRNDRPGLPVILMSGYADDLPASALMDENKVVFLQKPFDTTKLTQALSRVLGEQRKLGKVRMP